MLYRLQYAGVSMLYRRPDGMILKFEVLHSYINNNTTEERKRRGKERDLNNVKQACKAIFPPNSSTTNNQTIDLSNGDASYGDGDVDVDDEDILFYW